MTKKCLGEAFIQAYLDGELPRESARGAAAHLAGCDACAAAVASAEQENSFFAAAFAPDADVAAPTELLRARINAAVAQLEAAPETTRRRARGRDFSALLAPLSGLFSFTPQRAAAFAGVLAVVAVAFVFLAVRRQTGLPAGPASQEVAERTQDAPRATPAPAAAAARPDARASEEVASQNDQPAPAVAKVSGPRPRAGKGRVTAEPRREKGAAPAAPGASEVAKAEASLPGEKNYQEAIASLERAVKVGGDSVLNPSARIEYERNIAVLDRAIDETRRAALRNPKDKDAVSFLMTAYQSKVELLTTVADRAQVAAIGR